MTDFCMNHNIDQSFASILRPPANGILRQMMWPHPEFRIWPTSLNRWGHWLSCVVCTYRIQGYFPLSYIRPSSLVEGFCPILNLPKVTIVFINKERLFETMEFAQSFIVLPLTMIAKRAKIKRLQIFPCINTCLNFEFNDNTVYCSPTLFCLHEMFAKS